MSVDETFREKLEKIYPKDIADKLATIAQDCMSIGGSQKQVERCIKKKIKEQNIAVDEGNPGAKTMSFWVATG